MQQPLVVVEQELLLVALAGCLVVLALRVLVQPLAAQN